MNLNQLYKGAASLFLAGMCLTACTDSIAFGDAALDKPSSADATKDTVFNNAEYTRQFLVGIYAEQYYVCPTKQFASAHSTNLYSVSSMPSPTAGRWAGMVPCVWPILYGT
jgi:hypothetical protein